MKMVTLYTCRSNIKRFRVILMMIFLGLLIAIGASQFCGWRQYALGNSVINFSPGTGMPWELLMITFCRSTIHCFAFFGLCVAFAGYFQARLPVFGLRILLLVIFLVSFALGGLPVLAIGFVKTGFALRLEAIFMSGVGVKLRNYFSLLTFRTLFCGNFHIHKALSFQQMFSTIFIIPISIKFATR